MSVLADWQARILQSFEEDVRRLMKAVDEAEMLLHQAHERGDMTPRNLAMSRALSDLVATVQSVSLPQEHMQDVLGSLSPRLPRLHQLLSEAEGQMEKYWAEIFVGRRNLGLEDLSEFTYMDNYYELTRREVLACREAGLPEAPRFMFVGSGPLPLSPILLQRSFPGSVVTCFDTDPEAVRLSTALIEKLGIGDFEVRLGNGTDGMVDGPDVLMVAALVNPKRPIMHAALESGTDFVIARSATEANLVLYPPVDYPEIEQLGLVPMGLAESGGGVINTTHVFASASRLVGSSAGVAVNG